MKLVAENIQRHLLELADTMRGDVDEFDAAEVITALWTLKALHDNKVYFKLPGVADWRTIVAPGEDVFERIRREVASVEKQIQQLSGVLSGVDLRSLDSGRLYRAIQQLERLDLQYDALSDPDPLNGTVAIAADAWFERLADLSGKRGDFLTPKNVKILCAKLLKVQSGSAYDGTAGVGGMLVEAAREAKRNGSEVVELFGQEVNESAWRLAQMNTVLHGIRSAHIARENVLMKPKWTENGRLMRFSYVIMNPPFATRVLSKEQKEHFGDDTFRRFRYGRPSAAFADMAFVQHAIASLDETGRGVVVQPHGALFRGGIDAKIRAGIVADHLLESVVFLPRNLLFNTGIPVALLVLNRQNPHPGRVLFIRADEDYQAGRTQNLLRQEDIDKICGVHHTAREVEGYSRLVTIEEIESNDWNLNYTRYFDLATVDSKVGQVQVSLKTFVDSKTSVIRLSEVADVDRGYGAPKDSDSTEIGTAYRLINLGDVDEEGIHWEKTTPIGGDPRKLAFYALKPNDVILSSRGTSLKVTVVPDTQAPLIASANFIVIRPRIELVPQYLKVFLESPVGLQQLQACQRGSAVPVLSHKDVRDIYIPKLPLSTQQLIANVYQDAERDMALAKRETERRYQQRYREVYEMMGINLAYKDVDEEGRQ